MNLLQKFSDVWSIPVYGANDKVEEKQVLDLETKLNIRLPKNYRTAILETGTPNGTMELWEWLDEKESIFNWKFWEPRPFLWHINGFYKPSEILESLGWREAGMPDNLLPFAYDSMGNQFCFSLESLANVDDPTSRVLFWDHDFGDTSVVGKSFNHWLSYYLP